MPFEWNDLSGIRTQIISNTVVAFPHISPRSGSPPTNDANPNNRRFNVIIRRVSEDRYEASIVYGNTSRVFATGVGQDDGEALLNLLETTYRIIGSLYEDGKLEPLNHKTAKDLLDDGKGAYDPGAGC